MSLLLGTLVLTDGCLLVVSEEESGAASAPLTYIPVLPYEKTEFDGDLLQLSGRTVGRVGDDVELVGGRSTVAGAVIPENCPSDAAQFAVTNG